MDLRSGARRVVAAVFVTAGVVFSSLGDFLKSVASAAVALRESELEVAGEQSAESAMAERAGIDLDEFISELDVSRDSMACDTIVY